MKKVRSFITHLLPQSSSSPDSIHDLCKLCSDVFQPTNFYEMQTRAPGRGTYWGDKPQAMHYLPKKHIISSSARCHLCAFILARVRQRQKKHGWVFDQPLAVETELRPADGSGAVTFVTFGLRYHATEDSDGGSEESRLLRMIFEVDAAADNPAATWIKKRPVNHDVASPAAFEKARRWIQDCVGNHERCPKTNETSLPTRVLDLKDPDNIRLHITNGQIGIYAALSYCWGDTANLLTTEDTLSSRIQGTPMSDFPHTLRDAILVSRRLGYQYLWIDALCIIQDSAVDKNREISKMRHIFQSAHLTIIAASASTSHSGFLHKRIPPRTPNLQLPYPCPDGSKGSIQLYETLGDSADPVQYDPSLDPVSARAWTLEERLLSPRRLIYTSTHLRYLCDTTELSDGGSPSDRSFQGHIYTGPPQYERSDRLPRALQLSTNPVSPPSPSSDPSDEPWKAWHAILSDYTSRALTHPSDKLRALSGISSLYSLRTGDTYHAGLWNAHLVSDLLWQVNISAPIGKQDALFPRPAAYRAPSWSWASVDGAILNRQVGQADKVVANDFAVLKCEVETDHSYGAVAGGIIVLKGRMRGAAWDSDIGTIHELHPTRKRPIMRSVASAYPDAREDVTGQLVWCLEVLNRTGTFKGPQEGLILVPINECGAEVRDEDQPQNWRRVGYFDTDDLAQDWFADAKVCITTIV
ncbi:heterokaryon incompatibility protein-domain-containing protein [Collybia nuda]|uniref:Heterokaryon incompatibility protein-domain-containing protein n=1 Tax=Collybia nuda TaxID=64659 RepID=A0A9P5YGW1_9AGAR|nr:heterokaryon incompatibility protein-domain-containing protein [Collybia nuda]